VIHDTYGHTWYYLWILEAGKVYGILPLVLIESYLFGRALVSLPFLDDAGICAENSQATRVLFEAVRRVSRELGVANVELRNRYSNSLEIPAFGEKVTLRLTLPSSSDAMWCQLNAKVRNQIRKATKSGLTVDGEGGSALDEFYEVFAFNMRSLGSPVHSKAFFRAILYYFRENVRLVIVRKTQKVIAGGICMKFKDRVTVPWASALPKYRSLCPNNLFYWEVIRWACDNGFQAFDFGRSSRGSGTYQFKRQWGATEEELNWQCLGSEGKTISIQGGSARFDFAMKAWRHSPLWLTKTLGPWLRKQMSN